MREDRISFILCTNDPIWLAECTKYIERQEIPAGYTVDLLPVTDAPSMCAGYNAAMRESDAAYKIYLHQDVFLLNRYFVRNLLTLFAAHPEAGMIGMVGTPKLADNGVMWKGKLIGGLYKPEDIPYVEEQAAAEHPVRPVACADGFALATHGDVPWREDLLDGWDLYDASQGYEFRKKGYQVLVPDQTSPWCLHDDGRILTLYGYNRYRRRFLTEYGGDPDYRDEYTDLLTLLEEQGPVLRNETDRIIGLADRALKAGNIDAFTALTEQFAVEPGRTALTRSTELLRLKQTAEVVRAERDAGVTTFVDGMESFAAYREKYLRCVFLFRRIEFDLFPEERGADLTWFKEQLISAYSAAAILYNLISLLGHREKILLTLAADALESGDLQGAYRLLAAIQEPSQEAISLREELAQQMI